MVSCINHENQNDIQIFTRQQFWLWWFQEKVSLYTLHISQASILHKSRKQIFTRQQLYDYEQKRCFLENTILNWNQKAIRCVHNGCLSAYSRIVSLHFIFDFDLSSILNLPGFNNPIGFSLSSHCYKLILKI